MGKAVINTTVSEEAKEGYVKSARPVFGEKGSMAQVVANTGLGLLREIARLQATGGELEDGGFQIETRIVPRRKRRKP